MIYNTSALRAAFAGVEAVRRRPSMLVALGVITFATQLFAAVVTVQAQGWQIAPPGGLATEINWNVVTGKLAALGIFLIGNSLCLSITIRSVLHPQDQAIGYLRLGRREGRLLLTNLAIWSIVGLGLMVSAVAVAIGAGVLAPERAGMRPEQEFVWLAGAFLLTMLPLLWISLRLALAPAISFELGRQALRNSWRLTRGRTSLLLRTYLFVTLFLVVFVVAMLWARVSLAGAMGLTVDQLAASTPEQLTAAGPMAGILLTTVFQMVMLPLILPPAAALYEQLSHRAEEVF